MDVIAREEGLAIRRMRDEPDEYLRMVRWRNEPHVREWWDPDDPPLTVDGAIEEYRSLIHSDSPTTACIIEVNDEPIGYIQFYQWSKYPNDARALGVSVGEDVWSLDVFIGEPQRVGRGVGPRAVDLLCRYLFSDRGASTVALVTAQANSHALHAYRKVGFLPTTRVLDTDTKDGQRVESWLMVRERSGGLRQHGARG